MRRFALASLLTLALLPAAARAGDDRDFMVAGFDRLRVDGPFEVDVVDGVSQSARAEGPSAALDRVSIRSEGGTLIVSAGTMGWEVMGRGEVELPRVTVTTTGLRSVMVTGGAKVHVAALGGDRVEASVNGAGALSVDAVDAVRFSGSLTGAGTMRVAGKAVTANFQSLGAGNIEAPEFVANDLRVRWTSLGAGHFNARYTARISAMGTGSVRVEGAPKCFVSGTGPVSCGDNDNIVRQ